MSKPLFDDSDDNSERGFHLQTNKDYAKSFNNLRKKELLQKFKDKGYSDNESESTSDSDSSEEDEVLDPAFDQEFLKTLASLKSKDPNIYNKNIKFFEKVNKQSSDEETEDNNEENVKSGKKEKKAKPVTLKDYERKIILEKGGKFVDDSDSDDYDASAQHLNRSGSPSLAEEERRLRAEFKQVLNEDDSADEEFGGIFKKREKSKAEQEEDEEDYLNWLAGKKNTIQEDVKAKLEPLKNYWSNDKLPSSEKFLRDYVLNKGYTNASNYAEIPTYEEIVGDNAPLSEDEEELEKQAEFEQKFNFRYEEPDQEFIKRFPRTIESSVRRTDEKRKQKRQEIKERKQHEKEDKMKELEMVKEMKRKEIEEKIQKLKVVTGNDDVGFKENDLDEDFDPEAHDRRMRELFDDDYYQFDEGEEKPECPSDIDELKTEDWDNYDPQRNFQDGDEYSEPHCEDEDFIMDCDYDPAKAKEELQKELIENTRSRKGRKGKRNRFMDIIKAEKPVFDPEDEKTYGEYIDEYYKLDCEDIIGDTPCRFKYVETAPNDFGLTIEEILLAKNKELNQWASLKKAIQIRPDQVEKKEQRLYKLKAKNEELKRKIFKSLYGEGSDNENEDEDVNLGIEEPNTNNESNNNVISKDEPKTANKKRKRKTKTQKLETESEGLKETKTELNEMETLAKKSKLDETLEPSTEPSTQKATTPVGTEVNKKKKKKNKKKNANKNGINTETVANNSVIKSKTSEPKTIKPKPNKSTALTDNSKPNKKGTNNPFANKTVNRNIASKTNISGNNANAQDKANPFANDGNINKTKNKFKNSADTNVGSLPPLRQSLPKFKPFNGKFKPKFTTAKKPFSGKSKPNNSESGISDERLKAYGINPKKFHKKQKYGGANKQQKPE